MTQILNSQFSILNSKILVIGDLMLDCYLYGNSDRISPEAPVPVIDVEKREYRLGGAANVALNLKSLGACPILCATVGNDRNGDIVKELLHEQHFELRAIVTDQLRPTTTKYRVMSNNAQVLRVDEEETAPISEEQTQHFIALIEDLINKEKIEAIVFEDYDKGLITKELIEAIVCLAKQNQIITTVDPKFRNFDYYQGVTLFKPNLKELCEGLKCSASPNITIDEIELMMRDFAAKCEMQILMTTLAERGAAILNCQTGQFHHHAGYRRAIRDVSGAGDTVIATATLSLLSGMSIEDIALFANLSGGTVCEKPGVVPITLEMLQNEYAERVLKQ